MTLHEITPSVTKGLPFRRTAWAEGIYYYYDINESWFLKQRLVDGDEYELITYTLDLTLEDLMATDWDVDDWGDENE